MLAVDLFEFLGRGLGILLFVEEIESLVVELVRRLVEDRDVLVEHATRTEREGDQKQGRKPQHAAAPLNAGGRGQATNHGRNHPVPSARFGRRVVRRVTDEAPPEVRK